MVGAKVAGLFSKTAYVTISVQYVLFSTPIEPNPENLKLAAPATVYDVEKILWNRHPALQGRETLQVLLNGTALEGNPSLNDGDKLVLLAQLPGG